jgi:hypothetical protein
VTAFVQRIDDDEKFGQTSDLGLKGLCNLTDFRPSLLRNMGVVKALNVVGKMGSTLGELLEHTSQ